MNHQTILVISAEDNTSNTPIDYLKEAGYVVFQANSGDQALMMIQQLNLDLVILDWNLPDLSAIAITRSIRLDRTYGNLPIILTGKEVPGKNRLLSLEAGVDLFLDASISPKEWIARIRALLRGEYYNNWQDAELIRQ